MTRLQTLQLWTEINFQLVLRKDTNRRADKGLFAPDKTGDSDTCPIN